MFLYYMQHHGIWIRIEICKANFSEELILATILSTSTIWVYKESIILALLFVLFSKGMRVGNSNITARRHMKRDGILLSLWRCYNSKFILISDGMEFLVQAVAVPKNRSSVHWALCGIGPAVGPEVDFVLLRWPMQQRDHQNGIIIVLFDLKGGLH